MIKVLTLIFAICSGLIGCGGGAASSRAIQVSEGGKKIKTEQEATTLDHGLKYELNQPNETFNLSDDLKEISGLGINDAGDFLYAVQDEKGVIFKISKITGQVEDKFKFHKDGDYEGIEVVGQEIFVIKSTGTIYKVSKPGEKEQEMEKFNSFLSKENDVEGLAYDKKNHRLLLACKGVPATGESFEVIRYKKVIYAFDIKESSLSPDPIFTIQLADIRTYLEAHKELNEYEKLCTFFSAKKENLTFNPSAISIHPLTGDIYVLSSSGKVLMVLDEKGVIVNIEKLSKKVHAQPEGMIFDKDGTLYIANEGKKQGKPVLHRFDYND